MIRNTIIKSMSRLMQLSIPVENPYNSIGSIGYYLPLNSFKHMASYPYLTGLKYCSQLTYSQ